MRPQPVTSTLYGKLRVYVFAGEQELAEAAAGVAARVLAEAVAERGRANLILATGNSQRQFLAALRAAPEVPWIHVQVFHMDEYLGLPPSHPAGFARYLRRHLVDAVQPGAFYPIRGDAEDVEAECRRYEQLLRENPADLCCLGIGENGHIAFNEPMQADFHDLRWVRPIRLHEASRRQQVGEGHFARLEDVPYEAITLTVPALLAARRLIAVVPEARKAQAVRAALLGPVSPACPASVLRTCEHAELYLDRQSAALLEGPPEPRADAFWQGHESTGREPGASA